MPRDRHDWRIAARRRLGRPRAYLRTAGSSLAPHAASAHAPFTWRVIARRVAALHVASASVHAFVLTAARICSSATASLVGRRLRARDRDGDGSGAGESASSAAPDVGAASGGGGGAASGDTDSDGDGVGMSVGITGPGPDPGPGAVPVDGAASTTAAGAASARSAGPPPPAGVVPRAGPAAGVPVTGFCGGDGAVGCAGSGIRTIQIVAAAITASSAIPPAYHHARPPPPRSA